MSQKERKIVVQMKPKSNAADWVKTQTITIKTKKA